jgi:hypothetical protein
MTTSLPSSLDGAAVKIILTMCVSSLLFLAGCQHARTPAHSRHLEIPEKRSSESEIQQHIVGEWTVADRSDDCWFPTLIIAQDGGLIGMQTNGTTVLLGKWELYHNALRVTPTPERLQAARASGFPMNDWDYFPVIYADDHELVMTPGISVAGRWRYKRRRLSLDATIPSGLLFGVHRRRASEPEP